VLVATLLKTLPLILRHLGTTDFCWVRIFTPEANLCNTSAQSPKDLLAHLVALTDAVDNLEILMGTGTFDSEKHCLLS
jgi:hypothetical protein